MHSYRSSLMLRITFLLLALALLSACGTIEIRVEMPSGTPTGTPPAPPAETRTTGDGQVEIVVTAQLTPPTPQAMTPTPTPASWEPPPQTVEPAFTPMPPSEYPAPAGLQVAFVRDGQLWLWTAGTGQAVALASADDTSGQVKLSDDGAIVAFVRENTLWAVNRDGSEERQLLSAADLDALAPSDEGAILNRLAWVPGTHTLALNTQLNLAYGLVLNDDLHLVDAETGAFTTLLPPGEGGEFYYSPDGSRIAVVTPGEISLVDADGGQREQVLTYTPVNTGSEYRFYAQPAWASDSRSLRVAIPPPVPHAQPAEQTTLWHIATDGTPARMLTSIDAAPLAGTEAIAFSPNLEFVAYAQLRQAEGASPAEAEPWLGVRRLANDDWQAYPYAGNFVRWAPDSRRFAFLAGRESPQLRIGQWSGGILPGSLDSGTPVFDVRWVDAEHYLVVARSRAQRGPARDGWDLILADIQGSSTILASMAGWPRYDLAVVPSADRPGPTVSPTPVASVPGLVYQTDSGLWIDRGRERAQVLNRHVAGISPDGVHALYVEGSGDDQDLWLAVLPLGEQYNLTRTADRNEDTPRWWEARPDVVVFSSLPRGEPLGIGVFGALTVVNLDGSGYRILDDQHYLNSPPAPSPDGRSIAYGSSSGGWLYHWETGPQPLNPADYGLDMARGIELGSPAWSPDGSKLAWVLSGDLEGDGGYRWGVGVFDLMARSAQIVHVYPSGGGDGRPPAPVWSPDGTWLAFEAQAASADQGGVWVVQADGQGEPAHMGGRHPVWSPDGRWLALSDPASVEGGHWMADAGTWYLLALDLPRDAQIVDWIDFPLD
jgi:Tol biopolymer transport system component